MKYDHTVKRGGVYYPAGAEVPAGNAVKLNATIKEEPDDSQITFETDAVVSEKPHVGRPRKQKQA